MTDPRRHDGPLTDATGTGPDSRVESLLVEGLDHYFLGHFEEAIHLWTRVLFLDRSHASARAYIERARGAILERQRRAEESLQAVAALLDQGRAGEARQQLDQASRALGEDERTAALRLRLERLERSFAGGPRIRAAADPAVVAWHVRWTERVTLRTFFAAAAVVVVVSALASSGMRGRLGVGTGSTVPAPTSLPGPVPVLGHSEVALIRARTLYARGRLAEALAVLDRADVDPVVRDSSDQLRVDIQRLLLAAADGNPAPARERQDPR